MKNPAHIKKILLAIIMLMLWIPMLQMKLNLVHEKPLNGSLKVIARPEFNVKSWLKEEYQFQNEAYINQRFGFRNALVRMNNQLYYSAFRTARAKDVIIGKEGYLFEENYIRAYLGLDFIGEDSIRQRVDRLQKVADTLRKLNKQILVVFAPGKASYFPEYIPDAYPNKPVGPTNYAVYRKAISDAGIPFIDFNHWFHQKRKNTPHPLFAKAGIHWSKYGEFLAADSITKRIGELIGRPMPELVLDKLVVKQKNEQGDYDIGEGMNLLFDLPVYPMAYPSWHVRNPRGNKSPKVLVISDSFYWGLFNQGFSDKVLGHGRFWYYNETIHPADGLISNRVEDVNIQQEVEENDVVVILCTEGNLFRFAFGFIDRLYVAYYDKVQLSLEQYRRERLLHYIQSIKTTPEWLENVRQQALEKEIPLEQSIRENAEYMLSLEEKENK